MRVWYIKYFESLDLEKPFPPQTRQDKHFFEEQFFHASLLDRMHMELEIIAASSIGF